MIFWIHVNYHDIMETPKLACLWFILLFFHAAGLSLPETVKTVKRFSIKWK